MTPEAALHAVPLLQLRIGDLEAENRRLLLQVQDLRQQLGGRAAARGTTPEALAAEAALLSLFPTERLLIPVAPSPVPSRAERRRGARPGEGTPGRKPLDPALRREIIVLPDPPAAERVCPASGVPLVPGFTEQIEVLARQAPVYYVKQIERTVWVSLAKTAPVATPWPADVLPRSGVHVSIVAHVAAAHYCEHTPYYRLEQQLARTGVSLPRSTQVSLMGQLDGLVAPVVAHIRMRVLESGYVHLDATPVDLCDPARPGAARSATLWAYRARSRDPAIEGLVWFDYRPTKSPVSPATVLREAEYQGVIQTDGAAGLDTLGPPERITHLGCFAHARRYVEEAVRLGDPRAGAYLIRIDRLFRFDARTRRITAGWAADDPRQARAATWRERFSVPVLRALFTRALGEGLTLPPKSALGIAVGYLLGQRVSLERCVTTPGAYLDNNGAENAIRPLKLGSKNWLFIGHPDAGPRLANLFTLVENCRLIGLDPETYLLDLLTRLPDHSIQRLDEWLPRAWQRARADGIAR